MSRPPTLARVLLHALTPRTIRAELLGDLNEGFDRIRRERGRDAARRWYWRQLLSSDVLRLRSMFRPVRRPPSITAATMQIHGLSGDVRYALRMFRKRPGVSVAVVVTLAMGIGATTAVFSLVNSVLLRPLPYDEPNELVMVFRTLPKYGIARSVVSYPDLVDWSNQVEAFRDLAAYAPGVLTYVSADGAEQWRGYRVTMNLLRLLGVEPLMGRHLTPADDRPGADRVIVLSHAVWQGRFGGVPDIIGRALTLDDASYTVAAVMPAGFDFPSARTDFWVPLQADPAQWERDTNFLTVIGRLADVTTVADAQSQLERVADRIDRATPLTREHFGEGYGVLVEPRRDFVVRNARDALIVFLGAVGLVLAIACANVANLMLVRGTERRRELAVRTALGARRTRLVRQLLIESIGISTVGGVAGVLVAVAVVRAVVLWGPELPRVREIGVDPIALLFSTGITLACGLLVGVLPALIATRTDVADPLKEGVLAGGASRGGLHLQQAFVVVQIGIATVLLVGATLLGTSFLRLSEVMPGFDPTNVVAARVTFPRAPASPEGDEVAAQQWTAQRNRFFGAIVEDLRASPTTRRVSLAYGMPFGRHTFSRPVLAEGARVAPEHAPTVNGNIVAEGYFTTMGISLVRGRPFTGADDASSPPVAVVNQSMAELLWPGVDPVGRRIRLGNSVSGPWITVIGVAADVRLQSLADDPIPAYYRPLAQASWPDGLFIVVRTPEPAGQALDAVRRAVWGVDPTLPVTDAATARDLVHDTLIGPRFRAAALTGFGIVAVALAVLGVYAVMAYAVGRRSREIGIQLALGASTGRILKQIVATGSRLTVAGIAVGLIASLASTRFLSSMLFGLGPRDPWTFVGCALMFGAVSVLACYVPARRAARLDPVGVLKEQ